MMGTFRWALVLLKVLNLNLADVLCVSEIKVFDSVIYFIYFSELFCSLVCRTTVTEQYKTTHY